MALKKAASLSKSAKVKAQLKHPVVDADGHWLELQPIFMDYLAEYAGAKMADRYRAAMEKSIGYNWYKVPAKDRDRARMRRQAWWSQPSNTEDRTAAMVPALLHDRLDAYGIDVSLVYPTLGFIVLATVNDPEVKAAVIRAYNVMAADMFRPYADRLIPAACISLDEPREAMAQLEHARSLGLKLMMMNGSVRRSLDIDGDWQPDLAKRRFWFDGFGLESAYDYDPVWKKCMELKVAVTVHTGTMGWPDRTSVNNFVFNHLGHFAQSHHLTARSLFMGGVTERFPKLNFGFLEGGTGWACNLYADIFGHWAKRNRKSMERHLKPTNFNRVKARRLMEQFTKGNKYFEKNMDEILARNLDPVEPNISQEQLVARDPKTDDFEHVKIKGPKDIARLFARNFYFGCEADDPMTMMAFDERAGLRVKALLGSDISHFDVIDATEVLEEAWEMVEHGLITEKNFREFTFTNVVELHGGMDPDFFKGTVVEAAAKKELVAAKKRDFTNVKAH